MNNDNNFLSNILDLISIILGYQNLIENREQNAQNNINSSNEKQAKMLLDDLHKKFDEQNKMLKEILDILKGDKK